MYHVILNGPSTLGINATVASLKCRITSRKQFKSWVETHGHDHRITLVSRDEDNHDTLISINEQEGFEEYQAEKVNEGTWYEIICRDHDLGSPNVRIVRDSFTDAIRSADLMSQCGYREALVRPAIVWDYSDALLYIRSRFPDFVFSMGYLGDGGGDEPWYLWCRSFRQAEGMYASNSLSVSCGRARDLKKTKYQWQQIIRQMSEKIQHASDYGFVRTSD
jgi:hypothetical protein